MKFIDIHTHVYPDEIAHKATASVRDFYDIGDERMSGTVSQLLQQNQAAGIYKSVILPVAIRADRVRGINQFIVEQARLHPQFVGFGTVHAGMQSIGDEAQWIMDSGLKGVKMHPDSQRFAIDDLRLFPLYEQIQGKLPVLLHMGDRRYDYSHPIKLRRILELFPKLDAIAAHFGGYSMYETACELLKDMNCVFDVSSSLMFMTEGQAERYIGIYGAERMAFGSDYPMWDPVVEKKRFLQLKLTWEQQEQIAYKTAQRILQL